MSLPKIIFQRGPCSVTSHFQTQFLQSIYNKQKIIKLIKNKSKIKKKIKKKI